MRALIASVGGSHCIRHVMSVFPEAGIRQAVNSVAEGNVSDGYEMERGASSLFIAGW